MLPFPIISNTNIAPQKKIIKRMRSMAYKLCILYSTGELYGRGNENFYGEFGKGTQSGVYNTWTLLATSCTDFWLAEDMLIKKSTDGTFQVAGLQQAIGNGSSAYSRTFVDFTSKFSAMDAIGIVDMYFTEYSSFVLLQDKTLYGCGNGISGLFGNGSTNSLTTFTQLTTGVDKVRLGDRNIGIMKGTTWYRSGRNASGELGTGNINNVSTFTVLSTRTVHDYGMVTAGVTLVDSGLNYSAGNSANGRLGNNLTTTTAVDTYTLYSSAAIPSTFQRFAFKYPGSTSAGNYNYMVCSDGLYATGSNGGGQCGTGDAVQRNVFTKCVGTDNLVLGIGDIYAGAAFVSFIWNNTTLYCTGNIAQWLGYPSNVTQFTECTLPL